MNVSRLQPLKQLVCRLQSHAGESYRRATTQGPIIEGGSLVSPGLASQRDRFLTARRLSNQRGLRLTKRGGGPRTPLCEGKGPENPGVVAPFCCYGLSRQPQARSGQTVGEDRPTSLPSSFAVVNQFMVPTVYYCSEDRRLPTDSVVGQVDDIRCYSTTGAWL